MIAGTKTPDSAIARQAEQYAREYSSDVLFNHVMRCYYFGQLFARQKNVKHDQELMFVSAVLHDLRAELGDLFDLICIIRRS